jgi:hypothetical protein
MARKLSLRKQFEALLLQQDKRIQQAFEASVVDLRSRLVLKELVDLLSAGNLEGAVQALHLDAAAYAPLEEAIRETYIASGRLMASNLPAMKDSLGARVVIRFDSRSLRAESFLQQHAGNLVQNLAEEGRSALRGVLETAMREGRNPRTTIRELVGTYDRTTGRLEGGLVGLSRNQVTYVVNAREELAGGTEAQLRNYLTRQARDKRYDSVVKSAIAKGEKLKPSTVNTITNRYSSKLIRVRAEAIARTEAQASIHNAKFEAFSQGLQQTEYPQEAVTKIWRSAGDGRVRHSHTEMDGQTVVGLNTPFVSGNGYQLQFPLDGSLGAGPEDIVNCRCDIDYRIDYGVN